MEPRSKIRFRWVREHYAEGGNIVGSKERERWLAYQRVDRSHRGVAVRQRRPSPWTMREKDVLVLSLGFIFAGVVLVVVLLVVPPVLGI